MNKIFVLGVLGCCLLVAPGCVNDAGNTMLQSMQTFLTGEPAVAATHPGDETVTTTEKHTGILSVKKENGREHFYVTAFTGEKLDLGDSSDRVLVKDIEESEARSYPNVNVYGTFKRIKGVYVLDPEQKHSLWELTDSAPTGTVNKKVCGKLMSEDGGYYGLSKARPAINGITDIFLTNKQTLAGREVFADIQSSGVQVGGNICVSGEFVHFVGDGDDSGDWAILATGKPVKITKK